MRDQLGVPLILAALCLSSCSCGPPRASHPRAPETPVDAGTPPDAGSAASLEFDLPGHDFGLVEVGTQGEPIEVGLVNRGEKPCTIGAVSLEGSRDDFDLVDACAGWLLNRDERCSILIDFHPSTRGRHAVELQVAASNDASLVAPFRASGVGRLTSELVVTRGGDGDGHVEGWGIYCGEDCHEVIASGDELLPVALTAVPEASSLFVEWVGCTRATGPSCDVLPDRTEVRVEARFTRQRVPLLVEVRRNGGQGVVRGEGIYCGPVCSTVVVAGARMTLDASADPGSTFEGWAGACTGTSPRCEVQLGGPEVHVIARFQPAANLAFVTSERFAAPNIASPAAADAACQLAASNAGLVGHFAAWVSTSSTSARDRLLIPGAGGRSARGWVRLDGAPFADTVAALTDADHGPVIYYPLRVDEHGTDLVESQDLLVMTATAAGGSFATQECSSSSTAGSVTAGLLVAGGPGWTEWTSSAPCDERYRLYCLQTNREVATAPPPVPEGAWLAFLSSPYLPGKGVTPAEHCEGDALRAGLTGPVVAAATNADRGMFPFEILSKGQPVFRPDGIPLITRGDWAATLFAPIIVTADGRDYIGDAYVWTGRNSDDNGCMVGGPASDACGYWTRGDATAIGTVGLAELSARMQSTGQSWFWFKSQSCSQPARLYCLRADVLPR